MSGPNKLECFITLGCKELPGTNTQAFLGKFISCKESFVKKVPEYRKLNLANWSKIDIVRGTSTIRNVGRGDSNID